MKAVLCWTSYLFILCRPAYAAAPSDSDIDDFEFVNIRIRVSPQSGVDDLESSD